MDEGHRMLWTESTSRKIFVKTFYNALQLGRSVPFTMSIIWRPSMPPKVRLFFSFFFLLIVGQGGGKP